MLIEGRDKNDIETTAEALDKSGADVGTDIVPDGGDDDSADVDVAVAVAADMALTGV